MEPTLYQSIVYYKTTHDEIYSTLMNIVKKSLSSRKSADNLFRLRTSSDKLFSKSYRNSEVIACFFHLFQSVIRKVHELGFKTKFENNIEVGNYISCFSAISFVLSQDL